MDLQQLRYLRAIVREGSLTAAARTLGVTQPALSVAIRRLEEELGLTLLVRQRDGVRPTPAGQELATMAHQVLTDVEAIAQRVRELETGLRGTLVLGCNPSLGAYFLPGFMAGFLPAYPDIELRLANGTSAEIRQGVIDGTVDFGLVVNTQPHPDLVIVACFHDVVEIYGLPDEATPDLADVAALLTRRPLVMVPRPPFDAIADRLAALGMLSTRRVDCGDLELAKAMALAGVGCAVLPRRVATYGHDRRIVPLHSDLPRFHDTIHLVFRTESTRTRAAQATKEALLAHGRRVDAA